jgi:hypothetical protein
MVYFHINKKIEKIYQKIYIEQRNREYKFNGILYFYINKKQFNVYLHVLSYFKPLQANRQCGIADIYFLLYKQKKNTMLK